jgi:microcystin-dependent protein
LNCQYCVVEVTDGDAYTILPDSIKFDDENNLTITFSEAVSGHAFISSGGGLVVGELIYTFSSPVTAWDITHNLGVKYVNVQCTSDDFYIEPQSIEFIDENNIEITFSTPVSGICSVVGGVGTIGTYGSSGSSGTSGTSGEGMPTGVLMPYMGVTAPTGWLLSDGKTVGSVSSGATGRANADTQTLFELLWNATTNTELIIQDSAGSPTTRGVTAAADFSANKRLPLPDLRGRIPLGKDNMGGSSANVVTSAQADALAGKSGTENHTLTEAEMPSHRHTQDGYNLVTPGSSLPWYNWANAIFANNNPYTGYTGGGVAHNNMQPYITMNYIIKL